MLRISLGVAALSLAASGALAQSRGDSAQAIAQGIGQAISQGQPGPASSESRSAAPVQDRHGADRRNNAVGSEQSAEQPPQRGSDDARRHRVDLRGLPDLQREAREAGDILTRATRDGRQSQPANASRPGSPAEPSTERSAQRQSGLRDMVSDEGTAAVFNRVTTGPLDRSARVLNRCPRALVRSSGCEPPGLANARAQSRSSLLGANYSPNLFGLTGFEAGRYLYRDGYLMQLVNGAGNGNAVAGYIPLLGGALASGNIWPGSYGSASVPAYLVDFYNLGEPGSYRYADNVLYRVDARSAAIQSVAALLTDKTFAVGEPLPSGYDVYNVPYPYRDRYADSANASYRYADGYVYRVDPATGLVAEALDLLT